MSYIYAMHGSVATNSGCSFVDRNMISSAAFEEFLKARSSPFVDLDTALAGEGDALTIDDATQAAADAAYIARKHGHHVTVFVNPENIVEQVPYSFLQLNVLLDRATSKTVTFQQQSHELVSFVHKKRFRNVVKERLRYSRSLTEDEILIAGLREALHVSERPMPTQFAPMSIAQLCALHDAGVRIENHGWSHRDLTALTWPVMLLQIRQAAEWLNKTCGRWPRFFAVPFGECLPVPSCDLFWDVWFSLTRTLPFGWIGPKLVNRVPLMLPPLVAEH